MSYFHGLYVQATVDIRAQLPSRFPQASWSPGDRYVELDLSPQMDWSVTPAFEISQQWGVTVFQLLFGSVTDSFRYERIEGGRSLRLLEYGCNEQFLWESVTGTPEPWEAEAFFHDEELLEDVRGEDHFPEAKLIWDSRLLKQGSHFPHVIARRAAQVAARFHGLGW